MPKNRITIYPKNFQPLEWLRSDLSNVVAYGVALLCALAFLKYMFPLSFFEGNSSVFDAGDNAQHVSGWWYYAKDAWHWPILHTERMNYPVGTNIAFTDSIPLAALVFKILITFFPNLFSEHFHYFGWWVGLVFVNQAIATTLLIRALGEKGIFPLLVSIFFTLTWPVVHIRYSHAALMMQSIILFALAFYFLGISKQWRNKHIVIAFFVLNVIALTVHPYFLPVTAGIFVAYIADQGIRANKLSRQFPVLIAFSFVMFAFITMLGYLDHIGSAPGAKYGSTYHLNLLAPFCGGTKLIPCAFESPIIRFEGFNYFGAGLIFLIPFGLAIKFRTIFKTSKLYPALFFVTLGFLVYAITNSIWIGNYELIAFNTPSWFLFFTDKFRAAGRFFWVIGYLILFFLLITIFKRKTLARTLLILIAIFFQWKDVRPMLQHAQSIANIPSSINYKEWENLATKVNDVVIYPAYGCPNSDFTYISSMQNIFAYYGKPINTAYTATSDYQCELHNDDVLKLKSKTLYLISNYSLNGLSVIGNTNFRYAAINNSINSGECVIDKNGLICLTASTPAFWLNQTIKTSPIKHIENGNYYGAASMMTLIGHIVAGKLTSKNKHEHGYLSYGPYVTLKEGSDKFSIEYSSEELSVKDVGNWDVVLQQDAGKEKILFSGKLVGTSGLNKKIEGVLTIAPGQETMPLEIRTYFLAQGDLQLVSTSLVKLP